MKLLRLDAVVGGQSLLTIQSDYGWGHAAAINAALSAGDLRYPTWAASLFAPGRTTVYQGREPVTFLTSSDSLPVHADGPKLPWGPPSRVSAAHAFAVADSISQADSEAAYRARYPTLETEPGDTPWRVPKPPSPWEGHDPLLATQPSPEADHPLWSQSDDMAGSGFRKMGFGVSYTNPRAAAFAGEEYGPPVVLSTTAQGNDALGIEGRRDYVSRGVEGDYFKVSSPQAPSEVIRVPSQEFDATFRLGIVATSIPTPEVAATPATPKVGGLGGYGALAGGIAAGIAGYEYVRANPDGLVARLGEGVAPGASIAADLINRGLNSLDIDTSQENAVNSRIAPYVAMNADFIARRAVPVYGIAATAYDVARVGYNATYEALGGHAMESTNDTFRHLGLDPDAGFTHAVASMFNPHASSAIDTKHLPAALGNFAELYHSASASGANLDTWTPDPTGRSATSLRSAMRDGWFTPEQLQSAREAEHNMMTLADEAMKTAQDPNNAGAAVFFPSGGSASMVPHQYAQDVNFLTGPGKYGADYLENFSPAEVRQMASDEQRAGVIENVSAGMAAYNPFEEHAVAWPEEPAKMEAPEAVAVPDQMGAAEQVEAPEHVATAEVVSPASVEAAEETA